MCSDSKDFPQVESDVLYTRIFGKGYHNIYQFTDDELAEIYGKAKDSNAKKGRTAIHAARMYKDAARLKIFHLTGKFPRVTKNLGILSLKIAVRSKGKIKKPFTKNFGYPTRFHLKKKHAQKNVSHPF